MNGIKVWIKAHTKELLIAFSSAVLLFGLLWTRCGIRGCPDVAKLKGYMPDQASTIVDSRGQEVGKLFLTRRFIVQMDSLPEYVPAAFVAMEDRRFYKHHGVDWRRVMGAFVHNVRELGITEGSSTITMQLARNAFPDRLPANKRTLWRKMAEARVAQEIEHKYSKREILQLYLNQVYFGSGAYGLDGAAQQYFGKPATKLNLAEAATLAALLRAPTRFNPRTNRALSFEGRKLALQRMVDQHMISADEAERAVKTKLRLRVGTERTNAPAPYFIETVRDLLEDELGDAIYTKGYTIYTTLDGPLQATLEQELGNQLRAIEAGAYGGYAHATYATALNDTTDDDKGTKYLQTAAIFMDPRSGDVRALVGGRNFGDSEYNRALYAHRQPGSAFKPFVYAAAFADGYSPTYRLIDQPLRIMLTRHKAWEPKNYDGSYAGVVTLRDAMTYSKNVPTIRLAMEMGITRVIDMARQMGLSGRIPSVPSVVLGTAEVTPMDMTGAFAGFDNLGDRPSVPRYVTKVVDHDGNIVWSQEPELRHVIDPAVAFMTVSLMQDVVDRGTAASVRAVGYHEPAAGKTGTTQDAADIWFIGMTPNLVGTIWMGFDQRQTIVRHATGGELAAPVWGRVMLRMRERSAGWAPPPGVEVRLVDMNGNIVGETCPITGQTRREYFLQGTAPIADCYAAYNQYTWTDTSGYQPDTALAAYDTAQRDEHWWQRMRERVFGKKDNYQMQPLPAQMDTMRRDTTVNAPPPQYAPPVEKPKPKPVPYDSLVKAKRDTLKQDTTKHDTIQ